jgi:hypothetical protein
VLRSLPHQDVGAARTGIAGGEHRLPGSWRSTFTLYCWTRPSLKFVGSYRTCPESWRRWAAWEGLKSAGEAEVPEGVCPEAVVAQYEVAKAQPAPKRIASDSPRKGGFCHRPCAPWLQDRVVIDGSRRGAPSSRCRNLPGSADAGFERRPIHIDARRCAHTILIGDQKLPGAGM